MDIQTGHRLRIQQNTKQNCIIRVMRIWPILKMETKYMTGQKLHCMQMIMVDTKLEKRNIWMPHP